MAGRYAQTAILLPTATYLPSDRHQSNEWKDRSDRDQNQPKKTEVEISRCGVV